jgi:hypothetical protein
MLITGEVLQRLVSRVVTDEAPVLPGFSELDAHHGPTVWIEQWKPGYARVHRLQKGRHEDLFTPQEMAVGVGYGLKPGELILAETRQRFALPENVYGVFPENSPYILFDEDMARQVMGFVRGLHELPEPVNLFVHCMAGVSRSAAVAYWVWRKHGARLPRNFGTRACPNARVLDHLFRLTYGR